ncbi:hypothetical protein [Paraburkholderia sp. SOS3]|jgi:hypothetical protein|uniref:hypothetical protein n=1 Tax=Paraburkholderia sp. SOS3 TaxID=1926494 RepID=UPI0012EC1FE7|nr:hypothetical protein [Paraburkholderia sp. SOS3]
MLVAFQRVYRSGLIRNCQSLRRYVHVALKNALLDSSIWTSKFIDLDYRVFARVSLQPREASSKTSCPLRKTRHAMSLFRQFHRLFSEPRQLRRRAGAQSSRRTKRQEYEA